MQSPRPVHGNIRLIIIQLDGPIDGGARVKLREFKETVKDGTVGHIPRVEFLHLGGELAEVVGCDSGEEGYVVFGMEFGEFTG